MSTESKPEQKQPDLSGLQQVMFGFLVVGDEIIGPYGTHFTAHALLADVGCRICNGVMAPYGPEFRVYRRIATPHQADAHLREMEQKLAEIRSEVRADMKKAVSGLADKAKTDDGDKPPLSMLPWAGLREVALVQAYGHKKYGDFFNYKKGMEVSRNISCAMRHMTDYMSGQDIDPESGQKHLAHAVCRLLFLLQNISDGTAIDDRYTKQKQ